MRHTGHLPPAARRRARPLRPARVAVGRLPSRRSRNAISSARYSTLRRSPRGSSRRSRVRVVDSKCVRPRRPRGARARRIRTRYLLFNSIGVVYYNLNHLLYSPYILTSILVYSYSCYEHVGVQAIGWHRILVVPITPPLLLCVKLSTYSNPIGCPRRFEVFPIGHHLGLHRLMHSKIRLDDAAYVCRALHAFGSMLNTALANALLLVAELCFWYQLSHVQPEWAERPIEQDDSKTNRTGGNSTETEMHLLKPTCQYPQTQNASRYPLPWIVSLLPVFLVWLQSFLFVNYSYICRRLFT